MKKISYLQYKAMSFLLPITMFFGIGLSNIVSKSEESFWLSILIGILFGTLILLIVNKIFMSNKRSILDNANKIEAIFYIFIAIIYIMLGISILNNLIVSIYLTEVNPFIISLPLILLIIYISYKGETIVARISVIILGLCLLLAFGIFLTLFSEIKLSNFMPFLNIPPLKIIGQGLRYGIISTAPLILLGCFGTDEIDNYKRYSIIKSYLVSSLFILTIFVITVGIMGVEMTKLYRYPEYIVLKRISLFKFINNIENFMTFFWILIYILFILMSGIFLKKSLQKITTKKWIFPLILTTLLFILYFTVFKQINYLLYSYKYQSHILAGCLLLFFIVNIKYIIKKK